MTTPLNSRRCRRDDPSSWLEGFSDTEASTADHVNTPNAHPSSSSLLLVLLVRLVRLVLLVLIRLEPPSASSISSTPQCTLDMDTALFPLHSHDIARAFRRLRIGIRV